MRTIFAPLFWLGRITLWLLFFPIGIWRSLVHHRKKAERRTEAAVADALKQQQNSAS